MTVDNINLWVSAVGSESPYYRFYTESDGNQELPELTFDTSKTYTFYRLNEETSHPFFISDSGYKQASSDAILITGGGNPTAGITGDQFFKIEFADSSGDIEDLLYYCSSHQSMQGKIDLFNSSAGPDESSASEPSTIVTMLTSSEKLTLSREQSITLDPDTIFDIPGVEGSVVELQFAGPFGIPPLYFELYDQPGLAERQTKKTAKNFLNYVEQGLYNGSIIHRAVPEFIIQGGGFSVTDGVSPIESLGPLKNEPGNSNVRGTVAMAKIEDDPNSATNQWFINLNDNRSNLDQQNGGFTVFGEVLGSGMEVADAIGQGEIIPATDINRAFTDLPIWRDEFDQPYFFLIANARKIERASELMFFELDSGDPKAINAQINDDGNIELTLLQSLEGPTTLSLTAFTGLDIKSAEQTYTIEADQYSTRAKVKGTKRGDSPTGVQISGRLKATDKDGLMGESIYSIEDKFAALNGTATIDPTNGRWAYTSNEDYSGSDRFLVTITDDGGGTTVQAIEVVVTAPIEGTKKKDRLVGSEFSDLIKGKGGNDRLKGLAGDDQLVGGTGRDVLTGGEGADSFVFNRASRFGVKRADKIKDFEAVEGDSILLDNDAFNIGEAVTIKSISAIKKVRQASKTDIDFVYDKKKGFLYFNENGKQKGWGDGGLFVKLQGAPELGADDFTIV